MRADRHDLRVRTAAGCEAVEIEELVKRPRLANHGRWPISAASTGFREKVQAVVLLASWLALCEA